MKMRWLVVSLSAVVLSFSFVLGHAATAKKKNYSTRSRTAACQLDCRVGKTHGLYRPYNSADPNLVSPEGRKLYKECVQRCLDPLPSFYVQKPIIDAGGSWFGMHKEDCFSCHTKGEPKRFWPGVITLPQNLAR